MCRSPRVYVGFRAPPFGDPRLHALEIAGQILSGGKGSRLHRRLVREERIAQDAAFFVMGFVGGASIAAGWATVRPGVDAVRRGGRVPRGAGSHRARARHRRRAGAGARPRRDRVGRGAAARGGSGRPAVDARDPVRRPRADQPRARPRTSRSPPRISARSARRRSQPITAWSSHTSRRPGRRRMPDRARRRRRTA